MEPIQDDQGFALAKIWKATADNLAAERDRLQEKADYWQRQYVIESENADDFHAERDRLIQGIGALVRDWRLAPWHGGSKDFADELEALTKTTEEEG